MIGQSCNFVGIGYQSVVLFVDLVELKIFYVSLNASVSGGIINYDSFVVTVVLHENRIQIVLNPKVSVVIVA